MKTIYSIIIALLIITGSFRSGLAQATLTLPLDVPGTPGNTVIIPVNAKGISNLVGFQFTIDYDKDKLTYVSISNWATGIAGVTISTPQEGKITFVYADPNVKINIVDGKFFDVNFTVKNGTSGSASLAWSDNPTARSLINYDLEEIRCNYVNGSVKIQSSCIEPVSPTSANASQTTITSGESTTLQVNGGVLNSAPNWVWYTGNCGGTQIGTGATLPVSPTSTTTYYVQASACGTSTICRSVTITVNSVCTVPISPTSATSSQTTITSGQSTTLQVNGGALNSAPNWVWYTGNCGGTQVGTGATLSVSPTSTTTYYVHASACGTSTTCRSVTITVNPAACANTNTALVIGQNYPNEAMQVTSITLSTEKPKPGETVTAIVSWKANSCGSCIVKANVFGSWGTSSQLTSFHDGWNETKSTSFTFTAPNTIGNHNLRFIWAFDIGAFSNYTGSNMPSSSQCSSWGNSICFVAEKSFSVATTSQENYFTTESYNLDNNKVPAYWTFIEDLATANIANGKINAYTTDAQGILERKGIMPTNTKEITLEWDGNNDYSYWGRTTFVDVHSSQNVKLSFRNYTVDYGGSSKETYVAIHLYDLSNKNLNSIVSKGIHAFSNSQYHYAVIITNDSLFFRAVNQSNNAVLFNYKIKSGNHGLDFPLSEINKIGFGVYTTTDNNNWLDNPSITINTSQFVDVLSTPNAYEFNVYPNPFNNYLKIINNGKIDKIIITNILGQCVKDIIHLDKIISTDDLLDGIYIISYYSKSVIVKSNIIIKNSN